MPNRLDASGDRHHAALVRRMSLALTVIDGAAAFQCWLFGPRATHGVLAIALAGGALACGAAYAMVRRGARVAALRTLVLAEIAVPALITLILREHDLYALMNLGAWLVAPALVAAAVVDRRTLFAIGVVAVAVFVVVMRAVGGALPDALDPMIFIVSSTALTAVVAHHRDRLDAIHQSEQRARNDELDALRRTLEDRVAERTDALLAMEKMALVGRLTAGIAHELASPLAAILASAEHVGDLAQEYRASIGDPSVGPDDHRAIAEELLEATHVATRAAERAANFVRSIKSQTRVAQPGKREPFDVVSLVDECVSLLAHASRAGKCKVVVTSESKPLLYWSAPSRLAQVVANLLQNAIDASGDRGGGAIQIEVAGTAATGVTIAVRDEAGGIPDEIRKRIFEPLFTTKPFGRGTGLGLSIVKEAVEGDLGGRVHLETVVGRGSVFVVALPPCEETQHAA